MIVISNTTPLRYLIEIGEADILPALFGQVVIPQAVFDELHDPKTPQQVKDWFSSHPTWLEIKTLSSPPDAALSSLDYGEREAISRMVVELVASDLTDEEFGRHPLILLLRGHGSRRWEDSVL